jgi:hypothetical protein
MVIGDPKISRLLTYFSSINKDAYQSEFLLANDVLSKTPPIVNMLEVYFFGREGKKTTFSFIIKKLLFFYIKNLAWIFLQFAKKIIFLFSRQNFSLETLNDKTVFIDTYILADQVVKESCYKDSYFPGLTDVLDKLGVGYVYVPKIAKVTNLLVFFKMLRVLKKENIPALTEYQLLGVGDFLQLMVFIVLYPFYVVRLVLGLGNKVEDSMAKFALCAFSGISSATYFRLLYGEKLSRLTVPKIKCISWYENQALDKCFYRGLRKTHREVSIYGAQLYIWSPMHLNVYVDEREIEYGVVPDKVLVNGEYFWKKGDKVNYQIGPSLRYRKLFQSLLDPLKREDILVLLPYWEYEISNILNCLKDIPCKGAIKVKFHPATNVEKYMGLIDRNILIVEGDIYSHFKTVRMVIGSATGALVEAASLGIPVINIVNKTQFPHMYLPNHGKGILWDSATTNAELLRMVEKFDYTLKNEEEKVAELAIKMREMFFCEPTEEKIIDAFDLA